MQVVTPIFEATLYPNRPLGRPGFVVLMAALTAVSAALGLAFTLMGAWPVTGFFGLDVALVYIAFRHIRREARRYELIRLDDTGLHVRRVDPDGHARDWRLEPRWARVHMDDPPRRDSRLTLSARGTRLAIGAFLTPSERLEVARSLDAALRRFR